MGISQKQAVAKMEDGAVLVVSQDAMGASSYALEAKGERVELAHTVGVNMPFPRMRKVLDDGTRQKWALKSCWINPPVVEEGQRVQVRRDAPDMILIDVTFMAAGESDARPIPAPEVLGIFGGRVGDVLVIAKHPRIIGEPDTYALVSLEATGFYVGGVLYIDATALEAIAPTR